MTTSNTADSTDKTFTVVMPKKSKSDLANIDRAIQDIRVDLEKHNRILKQLLKIDGIDVITYKQAEKVTDLTTLLSILKLHLKKMGGR